ncbi:MAG: anti-sigma F factor [Firmicutes bacterium]|nr:anti-sigma F factor [Bacillota bacterium]
MENRMTVRFAALGVNESFARSVAAAFAAHLDPTLEELTEIKTGVSEAVSNSIIHGYREDPEGIVEMECKVSEKRYITLIIRDWGAGIEDVEKAREPMFTTGKPEERSGMGFTVMESFMDRVEVVSEAGEGTTVTMTKRLDACGK